MAETIEIGVISDTHGKLPGAVFKAFEGVAGIVHCGDVCDLSILDELAIIAPVWAVGGNMDASGDRRLPPARVEKCGDVTIAVTHGHLSPGWGAERVQGLARMFAGRKPDVVCYGHSHRYAQEWVGGVLMLNPGAVFRPRDGHASVAVLSVGEHGVSVRRVSLD